MGNSASSQSGSASFPEEYNGFVPLGLVDSNPATVTAPASLKPRPHLITVTQPYHHQQQQQQQTPAAAATAQQQEMLLIKLSKLGSYFLDLSHLNLSEVVSGPLRQAHHLRGLHLSFNKLTFLPEMDIACLANICFLDLSSNLLTSLPSSLSSLTCLIDLKLSRNCLTSISPALFTTLSKLESLDLAHNQLVSLPQSVSGLTALTALHLDGNPLSTLPFELSKLKFLRHITLEGCPLLEDFNTLISIAEESSHLPASSVLSSPSDVAVVTPAPKAKVPTLKELAGRVLVRCSIPVTEECAPKEVVSYLASASTCSFCSGPYFEHHVKRFRFVVRSGVTIPMEFRLCSAHWTGDKDRILTLFRAAPATSPITLPESTMRAIIAHNSCRPSITAASPATADLSPKKKFAKSFWSKFNRSNNNANASASASNNNRKASRRMSTASHQGSTAAASSALSSTPSLSRRRKASTAESGISPSGGESHSNFTRMEFVDEQRTGVRRSQSSY